MRKFIYGTLLILGLCVGVARIPIEHPCCVCEETAYVEPYLATFFANTSFVHQECMHLIPYDPTAIDRVRGLQEELGQ